MAVLGAVLTDDVLFGAGTPPALSNDLDSAPVINLQGAFDLSDDNLVASAGAYRVPAITEVRNFGAVEAATYFEDFYFRLHFDRKSINFGNISGALDPVGREIKIWNSFLEEKIITEISHLDDDGIIIVDPPALPLTLNPTEELVLDGITVNHNFGRPLNGTIKIVIDGISYFISVTASFGIVWSIEPDWTNGILETLEWSTASYESRDITGNRVGLIDSPIRNIAFDVLFKNNVERTKIESQLFYFGAKYWFLPIFHECNFIYSTVPADTESITLDRVSKDFVVDGSVVFMNGPFNYEIIDIESISGSTLNFKRGTTSDWPPGSKIYPCALAVLNPSQSLTRFNGYSEYGKVSFRLDDDAQFVDISETTYRSLPLMTQKPIWVQDLTNDYNRIVDALDFGLGKYIQDDLAEIPTQVFSYHWFLKGKSVIDQFRAFLNKRKGKLSPVWLPTFQSDLELYATSNTDVNHIDVHHIFYSTNLVGAIGRKDIRIELTDGTIIYKRITASEELDEFSERLTLDSNLSQTITTDNVFIISFMSVATLNTDRLELAWETSDEVSCSAQFITNKDDY